MDVTIPNEMRFQLEGALMLYHQHSPYTSGNRVAAILHRAKPDGSLAPGRALDMQALEYFFRNANGSDRLKYQEAKVLARSFNSIVWFEKSRRHPIYFVIDPEREPKRKLLNQLSGREVLWPPLLFMIANDTLHCRALRSNRRPTLKTPLYIAPFTHIAEVNGAVCLPGEIRLDRQRSLEENMAMISELFYQGQFGHTTGSMKQINHPKSHDGFWKAYLKQTTHTRFPVERLKPTGQNLEDLLK